MVGPNWGPFPWDAQVFYEVLNEDQLSLWWYLSFAKVYVTEPGAALVILCKVRNGFV